MQKKKKRQGEKETRRQGDNPGTPMNSGIWRVMASRYTRCSMRSARSPGSMSMTGISTIV